MRLRPRHYVLFLVIVAVFVFNIVRNRRPRPVDTAAPPPPPVVHTGAPPQSAGWAAFDAAATLRDAADAQYQPALNALQKALPADPYRADLNGCLTWLEFYRQGMANTRTDPQAKQRSIHHLDGCQKYHLDTAL